MAVNQAAQYPALLHPGAGESETAPFAGAGRITNHVNCGMPPVFEAVELESLIKTKRFRSVRKGRALASLARCFVDCGNGFGSGASRGRRLDFDGANPGVCSGC